MLSHSLYNFVKYYDLHMESWDWERDWEITDAFTQAAEFVEKILQQPKQDILASLVEFKVIAVADRMERLRGKGKYPPHLEKNRNLDPRDPPL